MKRTSLAVAALLSAVSLAPRPVAAAFRNVVEGDEIRDRVMTTLDGGAAPLLGRADVSVMIWFRPSQPYSLKTLVQMAELEDEFAGKPVRFVAVTSASYDRNEVRAMVKQSGIHMPVLLDASDELYGELGVRLHPVVAVADSRHRLAEYQHFVSINMLDATRGRIQRVLGEISVAQLQEVLDPEPSGPAVGRVAMPGPDAFPLPPDHFARALARACAVVPGPSRSCAARVAAAGPALRAVASP
jgi:hypothetical protein